MSSSQKAIQSSRGSHNRGFTLIELLVVMSVMSILVGIGVGSFNYATKKARETKVKADFAEMYKLIEIRRVSETKTLAELTGQTCSLCACDGRDADGVVPNPPPLATEELCVEVADTIWTAVTGKAMPRDPWGNPYIFDENEGELTATPCLQDTIRSAGPDGRFSNGDDIADLLPLSSKC